MKKMIGVAAAVLISAPAIQAAVHPERKAHELPAKEAVHSEKQDQALTTKEVTVTPHEMTVAASNCLPGVAKLPSCSN